MYPNNKKYQKNGVKKFERYSFKKFSAVLTSTLVGTNLVALLVGTNSAFALENQVNIQSSSVTESLLNLDKVTNGSFENNFKSSNQNWEYKAGALGKLVSENGNSYATIQAGNIDDYVLQVINTTPGKKYTVSADIKVTVPEGKTPSGVFLTTKRQTDAGKQGSVYKQLQFTAKTNNWERKEFEFTADTYKTYVGIVKWAQTDGAGNVRSTQISMDNVKVIEEDDSTVIWEDGFSEDVLDQDIWGYELGNIRGNEQQHYVDSKDNVFLEDGKLVLKATNRELQDQYRNTAKHGSVARNVIYDSGSVRTHGKMEFLYGRIEMKAKLPKGKGAFPAFWTLGADFMLDGDINPQQGYGWPSTGEIDIMELIGAPTDERLAQGEVDTTNNKRQSNKIVYGTPHFYYGSTSDPDKDGSYSPNELGGNITLKEDFHNDFHVFGINWSPNKIEWYVDGVVYNTMYLTGDARLQAAAASLNRPQYIQFNLATGGNWAGDAGSYLGEDDTRFEIDWVRWSQNAEQKAAADEYYKNNPNLTGVKNITMIQGEAPNLLQGISVDKENYLVDFSIDDEYMFSNAGGNTNVTLRVSGSQDVARLKALEPGVYNIHYSAFPKGAVLGGKVTPTYKVKRETAILIVLPKGENAIKGNEGDTLSSVKLPNGWKWEDSTQVIDNESSYRVIFNNVEQREEAGKERTIIVEIPGEKITGAQDK
ncbi:MAG: family 16 glycosylhydrolase [Clostridium sp.]|nr:family 16 glycosylhydrolase [Clostridium sp.]